MTVLPEDGAVRSETCSRYLVNNTNIHVHLVANLNKSLYENARNRVFHDQIC
jgi:hypothetical protein